MERKRANSMDNVLSGDLKMLQLDTRLESVLTHATDSTPQSDELSPGIELSDADWETFATTELAEKVFEQLTTRDLVRARGVCKYFSEVIMNDKRSKALKMNLFLKPSTQSPAEYTLWKQERIAMREWSSFIGNATEAAVDFRSRPIHELNPAIAQYEVLPEGMNWYLSETFGFEDCIFNFDAEGFAAAIKNKSPWEKMLLTQRGCEKVTLEFKHDTVACYLSTKPSQARCELERFYTWDVLALGPGGFVTLADVRWEILWARAMDRWVCLESVRVTIEGVLTQLSNCVQCARAREGGGRADSYKVLSKRRASVPAARERKKG